MCFFKNKMLLQSKYSLLHDTGPSSLILLGIIPSIFPALCLFLHFGVCCRKLAVQYCNCIVKPTSFPYYFCALEVKNQWGDGLSRILVAFSWQSAAVWFSSEYIVYLFPYLKLQKKGISRHASSFMATASDLGIAIPKWQEKALIMYRNFCRV